MIIGKNRTVDILFKALLPFVVAFVSGCGRSSSDGPYVDLPDSATVVSVNGACYAKSYVEQNVKAMKPVGAPLRFARICFRLVPLPEPSSVWADLPEPLPEDEESAYAAWLERLKQSATIKTAAL